MDRRRRVSSRQRTRTRMPVRMRDASPASTACSIAVSAPSSRISAHANGRLSGCFGRGSRHPRPRRDDAAPARPRRSRPSASPVSGSYSCGGTSTRPSRVRTPTIRRSRSPPRNCPITGPTLRVYVYSSTCGAVSVPWRLDRRHALSHRAARPRTAAARSRTGTCPARPRAGPAPRASLMQRSNDSTGWSDANMILSCPRVFMNWISCGGK